MARNTAHPTQEWTGPQFGYENLFGATIEWNTRDGFTDVEVAVPRDSFSASLEFDEARF